MKHYVAQQHRPIDYAIAIGVTCLVAGLAFFSLNQQRASVQRATATLSPLQTTIIAQTPSQEAAAAPPPPALVEPSDPYIPPPKLNIAQQAPTIKHVTHKKPVKAQKASIPSKSQLPSESQSPSTQGTNGKSVNGKAGGTPNPGDHAAGAVPINNVQPEYPQDAQEQSREGNVTAICDILATGKPANCKLLHVRGGHDFAESALEFLNNSGVRYQPAVQNGQPVTEHNHVLHIDFTLSDGMN